jgi:outer membrane protein assembly factor BamC
MHAHTPPFATSPLCAAALTLALALSGCSMIESAMPGDHLDYRSGASKTPSLEVPPDLTPLAKDGRYQPQSGSVSASALAAGGTRAPTATAVSTVALQQAGDIRLERSGAQRWLVSTQTPEQLWPRTRQFWLDRGFVIATESAEAGTLETEWAENRAKLPNDIVRRTLGTVVENLFSTGERDRFLMRLQRNGEATEIYVTHRGLEEVLVGRQADGSVQWVNRPADSQLEQEMLARLMVSLGAKDEVVRAAVAGTADTVASKARMASGQPGAALEVDDALDRAWRRIGLALDRGGFTVEDRDRGQGLYFVRYVDAKEAAKDGPGFFARLLGSKDDAAKALNRYRIQVKPAGSGTLVSVLNYQGEPDNSANAKKIVSLLVDELKL